METGIEDLMKTAKEPEIEQETIDDTKEIKKPLKDGRGPKSLFIVEWNRQTREMFRKGSVPKQGRRYTLKCARFDGKNAYFILDPL